MSVRLILIETVSSISNIFCRLIKIDPLGMSFKYDGAGSDTTRVTEIPVTKDSSEDIRWYGAMVG